MAVRDEHAAILRNAIDLEAEGREFFLRAADRMQHAAAKDMFRSLARQEERHISVLEEQLRRVQKGEAWVSPSSVKVAAVHRRHVFKDEDLERLGAGAGASELDVIRLGMDIEKRSIDYYRRAGSEVKTAKAREVFNWLVGEEAGHLTILKAEYDNRARSGFYFDAPEFSLEVM